MHRIIAAILAATSCAVVAHAQDASASPTAANPIVSLDDAVAAAGGSAPAVEAAEASIHAAQAGRRIAGLRPNPTIDTQVENITGSGPYRGFHQAETTVSLALPIELGGKRSARIAVADAQTQRAVLGAAITQADVRLQVKQLYIETVAAKWRALTARGQLYIAEQAFQAAQVRVRAGRASPIEEQRADVARLNAEASLARSQRLAEAAQANLERRIGVSTAGMLDMTALDRIPPLAYGPVKAPSAQGTLALAAADADLAFADAGVRLAKAQRVPDLTVGPGLRWLEATNDTAAVFTVSIPFPVFNSGRSAIDQASAERNRAEAQRRVSALDIEQAITDARAEADNAATTARNANGPALAAAQEAARIARIGYREGKFGQLELLDAERTLAETRVAAIDALAAYQNAKAKLERLTTSAPAPMTEQGD
jgi:cobalt-zinc-cadmium efflux system outer membrane protein